MLTLLRLMTRACELLFTVPVRAIHLLTDWVAFNPRLGPLRYVLTAAVGYLIFAFVLVYVVAPLRGFVGHYYLADKLRYDAERWLATAIHDARGNFVGTFDPRLDSQRDVNFTDTAIEVGDYVASPDHKSIPVREVPEHYWQCLVYQEDRHLGTVLNPFGIDLIGVLKIPYSTIKRTLALGRASLGVGGSTLPMQLSRVIYKTPPSADEDGLTKLSRKFKEWWLAPVIQYELTRGGDTALKQWAANHLWLAQRTGGTPLHGVEVTSQVVFGKEAKDLSIAEQFVLASAVNKPIILLEGNKKLNAVRVDRWRYITEVRARTCAEKLITDDSLKQKVIFELIALAGGPPDPHVRPKLHEALEHFAPTLAARAQANPIIRANALLPAARFGLREEMKETYGFGWREHVRGVTTTLDAVENLRFAQKVKTELGKIHQKVEAKLDPGFVLAPALVGPDRRSPHVIIAAANAKGEIVRYFETGETAPYFGSIPARDTATGAYDSRRESRMIASTGKMIAAIAIANELKDTPQSLFLDTEAPESGLDTCAHGGSGRHGRKAIVVFACSLNNPLLNRTALTGQMRVKRLIDGFGFTMPPRNGDGEGTPPSTAAVLGQVAGAPRRVHHMAGVVLAALTGRGSKPVPRPTLVKAFDYTSLDSAVAAAGRVADGIVPDRLIRRGAHGLLRRLLQSPLCYEAGGAPQGTLKSLSHWCAARRPGLRLHFAKTGTQVTADLNATVDAWITGGVQFSNGASYSYVVVVGTGSAAEPWAHSLHAAQVAAPLLDVLLGDLEAQSGVKPTAAVPADKPRKRLSLR